MESNNYFVYKHTIEGETEPFYIGIGKHTERTSYPRIKQSYLINPRYKYSRAYVIHGSFWKEYIKTRNNTKWFPTILIDNITFREANNMEIELIKKYGRIGYEEDGILTNRTLGGFGSRGIIPNEEKRNKIRKTLTRYSPEEKRLKLQKYNKLYYKNNKEKIIENVTKYHNNNKQKIDEYQKKYRTNKDKIKEREYQREYMRQYRLKNKNKNSNTH